MLGRRMCLLLDENVPESVAQFFRDRGHEVRYVRDEFPKRTPDTVISKIGDEDRAIVVTCDRDFKKLASRVSMGQRQRFRNLSRILYRCRQSHCLLRTEKLIDKIESDFAKAMAAEDRLIVDITETTYTLQI